MKCLQMVFFKLLSHISFISFNRAMAPAEAGPVLKDIRQGLDEALKVLTSSVPSLPPSLPPSPYS